MDTTKRALEIGVNIHGFLIVDVLAQGPVDIIYKAHNTRLNRFVVLKEYMPQDMVTRQSDNTVTSDSDLIADTYQKGLKAFLKQAQDCASTQIAGAVTVIDIFEDNNTGYIVMPFVESKDYTKYLSNPDVKEPISTSEGAAIYLSYSFASLFFGTVLLIFLVFIDVFKHILHFVVPVLDYLLLSFDECEMYIVASTMLYGLLIVLPCMMFDNKIETTYKHIKRKVKGGLFFDVLVIVASLILSIVLLTVLTTRFNISVEKLKFQVTSSFAKHGNRVAQTDLGDMYDWGRNGVEKDKMVARYWYTKAAEQRDVRAIYKLGTLYYYDENNKAGYWLEKAFELGEYQAAETLGDMYCYGRGVSISSTYAVYWYKQAANANFFGRSSARKKLAYIYEKGMQGSEPDYNQAVVWYKKAAEAGDSYAQEWLKERNLTW